ncbi:AfsR/SARP family transcriptional regulator [Streptomyces violaceus]|uniref:BTAD domain-containing putative transcriptional regulator n=1 Tax=Streptomyces violaceus TaxID=1936 RepID=A0ABY9UIA0_STRVL|nr:BTAD domain-containing putative transcriptional regulator [Streptomyces janthinus]WND19956.1 BTAD domain-containing putative transcriptional regulator [Streptomyces janthinus]GGS97849.1 AfsR family transcriptional regulator [Streptomyces janthinus]
MRYRILGTTTAEDDHGTAVPLGGPRLRALLTALALRPSRITTPRTLIDEVWADDPPQDAPAALQALIGRLRRALGKDAVTTSESGGYRLTATQDDIDLFVFERLVQQGTDALAADAPALAERHLDDALALWRGPALADLTDRSAATRPEATRLEAARARAEARLRLGRARAVVPELRELTAVHPYDEPLHALLIRALRDTGRQADALAAYDSARRALAEGLGTDPGPQLRALHAELLGATAQNRKPPPTAPARPERTGNIRPRLTSFVGREPEISAIRSDVHRARLVTLTGPGGSGKTRLAEEAAAGLPQAWLAELAPLDRPEAVPGAVVSALGLRETVLMTSELTAVQDDPVALLVEYCAPRSHVLILDNCEHVVGAAAHLAETLLTRCPGLTILATSREPLGVPGELVRPVEPLRPDQARRLFAERAAAVRPDTDAVLRDERAVTEICRRLDGLPLAIELAAARLRLLTPRQIADRLDDRFRLLTSGSRTVLPRQQTLRAVVDWSWDLLDEAERTMLCEVSVFAGGWDLEAAEAVCSGPAAELIGALVDKSLVVAAPGEGEGSAGMRYRMLETIHEYAVERAAEVPPLRAAAERRHHAWARALVERADPLLRSAGQLPWISRLETELDNIRAALDRTLTAGDEAEAGALALAMGWFWWLRTFRHEGMEWLDRTLRLGAAMDATGRGPSGREPVVPDPVDHFLTTPDGEAEHPLHALRMQLRMLHLFFMAEDTPMDAFVGERRQYVTRVWAYFEAGGPQAARVPGLVWPMIASFVGELGDVRAAMDSALANCRAHGGDWETAVALMFRTHMVVDAPGDLDGVDDDLAELRTLSRRAGDRWLRAQVCSAAAEAAMARGRFEEAKGEYEEALRLAYEVGAYAESPFLIARLAEIAYRAGDRPAALAALDEASAAADRYVVADSKAFVLLLRAQMAFEEGHIARARELCEAARVEAARGTPPPQFMVMLDLIDAVITASETAPEPALAKLAAALRDAVDRRCSDVIRATVVDSAAGLLADLGDFPRAARLLGAGDHWRAGRPRPMPEHAHAERTATAARAALGSVRWASERTLGAGLTADDVLRELDEARSSYAAEPR